MDASLIATAFASLNMAKELGKAALGIRDFNEIAPVISQLNDQLLKAQEAMLRHNAELFTLQNEHFETAEQLRKMRETVAERGRYSLVELSDRVFAYRMNVAPRSGDVSNPISAEPTHHVCQPCFDKGVKSVLQKSSFYGAVSLDCLICKGQFPTGETEPYRSI